MSLPTPGSTVQKLQSALQVKAKSDPGYRFYSLWDKICRKDVMIEAYERCRRNGGAPGVDRASFEQIEDADDESWLDSLRQELIGKTYRCQPLLRVWIPKANGGQRPLGILTIRDRIVQMAMLIVLAPIFEADLCDEQYGFRSGVDAKMLSTQWRLEYNHRRPHSSLGYVAPAVFAASRSGSPIGAPPLPAPRPAKQRQAILS